MPMIGILAAILLLIMAALAAIGPPICVEFEGWILGV
jgi:hypothetical protein